MIEPEIADSLREYSKTLSALESKKVPKKCKTKKCPGWNEAIFECSHHVDPQIAWAAGGCLPIRFGKIQL